MMRIFNEMRVLSCFNVCKWTAETFQDTRSPYSVKCSCKVVVHAYTQLSLNLRMYTCINVLGKNTISIWERERARLVWCIISYQYMATKCS